MPVCEVCNSEDFTELYGHFYCSNCQTQSQDLRVVEADDAPFDQWPGLAIRIREKQDSAKPKTKEKDKGRPWSIYEAYQIILQHQVEALIKLGAQETLKDVVFKLWINYLSQLGLAFSDEAKLEILKKYSVQRLSQKERGAGYTQMRVIHGSIRQFKRGMVFEPEEFNPTRFDWEMFPGTTKKPHIQNVLGRKRRRKRMGMSARTYEKLQLAAEMRKAMGNKEFPEEDDLQEDDKDDEDEIEHTDEDDYSSEEDEEETKWGRGGKSVYKISPYKMQMKYTLVFCYIGLLYTNPGTTVSDLIRWVRKGQVPYLNAVSLIPEDFKFNMSDWTFFGRGVIPSPSVLRQVTGMICSFLGLEEFPVFPLSELISKYILVLDLPAEMHSLAISLYKSKSMMTDYRPRKHYNKLPFWEGLALSYIIITLKLFLGLNDNTERMLSVYSRELMKLIDNSHQLFVWEDWVKYMKRKCMISEFFRLSSQQQENSLDTVTEEARLIKDNIRYTNKTIKLFQPEVREKIIEPLTELGRRWKSKQNETGLHSCSDVTFEPDRDLHSNPLMDEDPVGYLLGNYSISREPNCQSALDPSETDQTLQAEQFRKSSLKHLSNPESYLDDLDKHGLSDYTILSSCDSTVESDEEWEPGGGCNDNTAWDPDFSPCEMNKTKSKRETQSDNQRLMKQIIKANVKSVPSNSKVADKEKYGHVTEQIERIRENFLLTFDTDKMSDSLSYNWLLQLCSQLIDCPLSELFEEVKKVEVCLFGERSDISGHGTYNFKRMKKRKMNYFTRRLKQF